MTQSDQQTICFVFGALRSGTTVFRLMLDHHPDLMNPGEVDFLFDHLHPDSTHATGWRYDREELEMSRIYRSKKLQLVDDLDGLDMLHDFLRQLARGKDGKLTLNIHRNATKIATLLPDVQFLHVLRDGRDVANSSIGMGWTGNSYYGVDHWIATERDWDQALGVIPEAQRMELRFEALMSDLQGELERVCAFLDVSFAPEMLSYHKTSSYDPPDPSIAQQWKRKADPRMIALIEGKCGDLLEARDYGLNGAPADPNMWEKLSLPVQNRLRRWQFNIKQLGVGLFLRYHISKRFGSKANRTRVRLERQERIQSLLK